jgi:hypothetical protein
VNDAERLAKAYRDQRDHAVREIVKLKSKIEDLEAKLAGLPSGKAAACSVPTVGSEPTVIRVPGQNSEPRSSRAPI